MADERNRKHLRNAGREDEAAQLTGPSKKRRGRGAPTGHMTTAGPVSDKVERSMPKERRGLLTRSARDRTKPAWVNR